MQSCIECRNASWAEDHPFERRTVRSSRRTKTLEAKKPDSPEGSRTSDLGSRSSEFGRIIVTGPSRSKHNFRAFSGDDDSPEPRSESRPATPNWSSVFAPREPKTPTAEPSEALLREFTQRFDLLAQQVGHCLRGLEEVQQSVSNLPGRVVDEWEAAAEVDTRSLSKLSVGKRMIISTDMLNGSQRSLVSASKRLALSAKMGALEEEEPKEDSVHEPKDVEEPPPDPEVQPPARAKTSRLKSFRSFCSQHFTNGVARLRRPRRGKLMQAMWRFLEEPKSGRAAWLFHKVWQPFVFLSVAAALLQSSSPLPVDREASWWVELVFDSIFAVECVARIYASPNIIVFLYSLSNIIDFLAALPLIARLLLGAESMPMKGMMAETKEQKLAQWLVCLSPTLRLLKSLRRFQQFHLFVAIISFTREALQFLLLTLVMIVMLFSALIYLAEHTVNSDLATMTDAMWLTVVTLATVGYGDISPMTPAGRLICFVLILGSVLFMAMPIGIIGNAFTEKWKDRDRIMMNHRFQDRILQCGYTVQDVVPMFAQFDTDNNGELSLSEFIEMVVEMQLGLQEDSAIQMFEMIDKNGSGGIDCREFVREFFPSKFYHEIYGHGVWSPSDWVKEKVRQRKVQFGARRRKRRKSDEHVHRQESGPNATAELSVERANKSPWSQWRQQMSASQLARPWTSDAL